MATINSYGGVDWYELKADSPAVLIGNDESQTFLGHKAISLAFLNEGGLVVGDNRKNFFILPRPQQDPEATRVGALIPSCNGFSGSSRFTLLHVHLSFPS
jgi:hypothetical protein